VRSTHPKILTILDPTSLLGRGVAERIARSLPQVRRRMFHTAEEQEHLIAEVAEEAALVPPLASPDDLDGSDAVLVTAQPSAATCGLLLDWLRRHPSVALLDCTQPGIAGSEACCVADRLPAERPARPWYHLADPALAAPFRFVAALAPLEPEALHLTVVCPVAARGAEALDELAAQGATRLSGHPMHRPDRLPAVLAFDLAPAGSGRSAGLEAQLGELFPQLECRVHAIDAGVFHGYLATVLVRCGAMPSPQRLRSLVRATADIRLAQTNKVLTTTEAVERGSVIVCGDLQAKGNWVSAWLLADGLAVGNDAVMELLSSLNAC
jgi:hypothetical protein